MTNNTDHIGAILPFDAAPPELSYPGLSPQLLARVKQLWSARGLDFDQVWRSGIRSLPGFRALSAMDSAADSASVDGVFLFDQAVLWTRALAEASQAGQATQTDGLTPAQWHGLAALSARLTEQLSALRLLSLTNLPLPAMQIARSLSEDVDMMLTLLVRPKLANRFAECRSVEDATDFWRRHIAGGRAFRAVSERLYTVGIDYSADTEYAKWRKSVLATLGAAVHSNALHPSRSATDARGAPLLTDDSLHFATFRIHELCAYSLLLKPDLADHLNAACTGTARAEDQPVQLGKLAGPLSWMLLNQMDSLNSALAAGDY